MESIYSIIDQIVPIRTTATGEEIVLGRELHAALKIETDYESWFKEMCEWGDLEEGKSFSTIESKDLVEDKTDHALTLDAIKEILIFQETPLGKKVRRTLIELGKQPQKEEFKMTDQFLKELSVAAKALIDEHQEKENKNHE